MIHSLPHFRQEIENVSIVIQQGPFSDVVIERRLGLRIEGVVEVLFDWVQSDGLDGDYTRR